MRSFRIAAIAALLSALATVARAGDVADLNVLGFSPDGKIFAFEEYGVQDGSGFPYANRFYIDTVTDRFLPGTPVRMRLDEETATVEQARHIARRDGEKIIGDAVLAQNRGFAAGVNAVTEYSADPFRMAVNPRPVIHPIDDPLEIRLEEIHLRAPENCEALGEHMGFRLIRIGTGDGDVTRVLHEDRTTPASRGCPNGYRIGGIQTFYPAVGEPVYAVLIAVSSYGFEGPDYRWMAVVQPFGN